MNATEAKKWRTAIANRTRNYGPDDPRTLDARRELAAAKIAAVIKATVDSAPPLTMEQGHPATGPAQRHQQRGCGRMSLEYAGITITPPSRESSFWVARSDGWILAAADTRQCLLESLTWLG